ncbi:MAG: ferredoxin, partial [Firmicutes bacterium]|nr:ferredoxin [Bacillota bacterium]
RFGAKSGFGGHILSFVLGSLSAGPIYAAFPISKALLGKGASVTNIVIIISSWAVIKVPMLANEAKFLGPKFMLTRWLLTVVAIFIMAKLAAVIMKNDKMQSSVTGTFESLVIKKDYCVGCCLCTKLLPGTYEMKNNKATVIALPANPEFLDLIHQSVQQCPTQAIVFTPTASENY